MLISGDLCITFLAWGKMLKKKNNNKNISTLLDTNMQGDLSLYFLIVYTSKHFDEEEMR